jgi:hypothetical protein
MMMVIKQQFVVINRHTILQETKTALDKFSKECKDKQFFRQNNVEEGSTVRT